MRKMVVACLALTVACSSESGSTDQAPASPDSGVADQGVVRDRDSTPATDDPGEQQDAVSIPWTHGVAESKSQDGIAVLRAIRTARHDDFDRIVFEFTDGPLPGYHVSYIDRPVRQCGSGEVVPLPGDAWLAIQLQPALAHTDEGRPTLGARTFKTALPNLLELASICDFEADVTWVGAVRMPSDFRIFPLREPGRLVVDVRHR